MLQLPDLSEDLGHGLEILDLPVPEQRDQDVKKVLFIFVLYVVLLWTFSHILMISPPIMFQHNMYHALQGA